MKPVAYTHWILLAGFLSGASALGYELIWTRLLALVLGHESLAVSGVLLGFFGGMALGAFVLDGPIRRSTRPAVWFIVLESVAALYALAAPFLIPTVSGLAPLDGSFASRIALAGSLLLPATFCMGATLVALTHAYRRAYPQETRGRGLGKLYAANTLGAMIGVISSTHLVMPLLGMKTGSIVYAGAGLLAAGLAWIWLSGFVQAPAAPALETAPTEQAPMMVLLLLLTGFVGIGIQTVGLLILAQALNGTVYTFAHALAIFLLGTALGSALYAWWIRSSAGKDPLAALMLIYTASLLIGMMIVKRLPAGDSVQVGALQEALWPALFFFVPSLCMGAIFAHLAGRRSGSIGKAYAVNTLGAALAPLTLGVFAVSRWGFSKTMLGLAALLMLLYLAGCRLGRIGWLRTVMGLVLLLSLFAFAPRSMVLLKPSAGWTRIDLKEGVMGAITVNEKNNQRSLRVNRNFFMGGRFSYGERRIGHLPLLVAPEATN
ncbi:MAG: hypothetical protein AAF492_08325, partial [Verrucomicrobiota bacterium]